MTGIAQCGKSGLARKLKGHEEKAEKVQPHCIDSRRNHSRVFCENGQQQVRAHYNQQPCQKSIKDSQDGSKTNSLTDFMIIFGTVIIAQYGLGAVGNAAYRQRQNFSGGVNHRHDAHIEITAVNFQGSVA